MLRGATLSASEITGTAVFRMVVSSDSMKNATATSQGSSRLLESAGGDAEAVNRLMVSNPISAPGPESRAPDHRAVTTSGTRSVPRAARVRYSAWRRESAHPAAGRDRADG